MIPRELLKKAHQIEIRTNRLVNSTSRPQPTTVPA